AVKAAKGETDQVTVHSTKSYQSYGWRSRRRMEEMAEAMDLEEQDGEDTHLGAGDPPQGTNAVDEQGSNTQHARPSLAKRARTGARGHGGSPRRMVRPRATNSKSVMRPGGLFRDHVVGGRDEAPVDGSSSDRTPARWEEIEREVSEPVDGSGSRGLECGGPTPAEGTEEANIGEENWEGDGDVLMGEDGQ
ncbi:MAG: hypothetical protein Q9196_004952, partial [Gyalolechia fulgens]